MSKIAAIPTVYGGVHFRSRLEARWAAFFDLLVWSWAYEPIDLDGYIPDFIIKAPHRDGHVFDKLVEVKPALKFADYEPAQQKINASGWRRPASCVGAVVEMHCGEVCLGTEWIDCEFWAPWYIDRNDAVALWREAGNRVQWKPGKQRAQPRPENTATPREVLAFFQQLRRDLEND